MEHMRSQRVFGDVNDEIEAFLRSLDLVAREEEVKSLAANWFSS